jgi:hypothetical protein
MLVYTVSAGMISYSVDRALARHSLDLVIMYLWQVYWTQIIASFMAAREIISS